MTIFNDTFTRTSTVSLDNHTPDIGTSWTRLWGTDGTALIEVDSIFDAAVPESFSSRGVVYTADATYLTADYSVTFIPTNLSQGADDPIYIFVRIQDIDNLYAVRLNDQGATNTSQLYKKVAGSWTALGSAFNTPDDDDVCELEIIGSALKFYINDIEVASATDTDITGIGKAGIGAGGGAELVNSDDDGSFANEISSFLVTNLGPTTSTSTTTTSTSTTSTSTSRTTSTSRSTSTSKSTSTTTTSTSRTTSTSSSTSTTVSYTTSTSTTTTSTSTTTTSTSTTGTSTTMTSTTITIPYRFSVENALQSNMASV